MVLNFIVKTVQVDDEISNDKLIEKDEEISDRSLNQGIIPEFEWMAEKNHENRQNNRSLVQDLSPGPPKYKAGVMMTVLWDVASCTMVYTE